MSYQQPNQGYYAQPPPQGQYMQGPPPPQQVREMPSRDKQRLRIREFAFAVARPVFG